MSFSADLKEHISPTRAKKEQCIMEENEVEKVDTPVEMEDTIELDPNDFTDLSEEKEDNSSSEGTEQPTDEEVDTPVETKKEETKEVDFTPLFNELSKNKLKKK